MGIRVLLLSMVCYCSGLLLWSEASAAERFVVVVGEQAPELEHFAAEELSKQLTRLFGAEATIASDVDQAGAIPVLVGNPSTNSAVPSQEWPEVSEQGIVLKSVSLKGKPALIVGGGSPAATLWAVYELGYRSGIRYLLREDVYPDVPVALDVDSLNVVMEPELRTRTWRTINDFPIGPESWPLADHQRLLGQLAKLKFNRIMLSVYPWHPFVHYECRGVEKQTGTLWFGEEYAIPRDAPGRAAFGGNRIFENPDFAGKKTYQERLEAGEKHVGGIIAAANRLGLSVGISISPLEFPREFAKALPDAKESRGLKNLLIAPGAAQSFDDPLLKELVSAKIRAYMETYPHIDQLYLTLPEFPEWDEHADEAWLHLAKQIGDNAPTLEALTKQATERDLIASGERGARSLKGNVVALAFLNELFQDSRLLQRPDGQQVELVVTGIDPELFPYAEQILPGGASTLNFIDYTARRVAEHSEYLSRLPAGSGSRQLIMTLADDNVGVLSQTTTRRLESLIAGISKAGWDGFSTRYWMLAELDPSVLFLARSSWEPELTAHGAHDDLFTTIAGKQSVSDRIWLALGHIEQATELIDQNDLGFAFPVEGMLMKHYQAAPAPEWWDELNEQYTQAMIELYRSHDNAHPRSRKLLFYWAKRSEYVLEYLGCVKALREAAIAKDAGDRELAVEHLETAMEQLYNALDTLSDVVQDQSDRGLIAMLFAYTYRPLVVEYEAVLSEE